MSNSSDRLERLRELISDVLEIEPEELTDDGDFSADYGADSLRAIEILARIDKEFNIEIPQHELPDLANLKAVDEAVSRHQDKALT